MPAAGNFLKRGALVVLEGCDRSGKSTQCKMLKETLMKKGHSVELFRFPDRSTAIGKVIGDYLSKRCELEDHAVHLLFSANRWEMVPQVKKMIEKGVTVIIDRYAYSGVAFTSAKPGFSLDWCKQSDVGLPKPDLVLFLTLPAEEAAKRGGFGEERYEQTEFQLRVAANYDTLKQEDDWKVIDAAKDIDSLHTELTDILTDLIKADRPSSLLSLWTNKRNMPTTARSVPVSPLKKRAKEGIPEVLGN